MIRDLQLRAPGDNCARRLGVPGFETVEDCASRQANMIDRGTARGIDMRSFKRCEDNWCPNRTCSDACYFAARQRRIEEIRTGLRLLKCQEDHLQHVSLVHPNWSRPPGKLATFLISPARQFLYRRLKHLTSLVAIGSFEASLNTELDGSRHWAVGIHLIVAGASANELKGALAVNDRYPLPENAKPLFLKRVENLRVELGYALKHYVVERRAYVSEKNGRIQRRHLPPPTKFWVEHDRWLASLPSGARTVAFGCQRRHGGFCPLKG